jgi:hypothetical protein
MDQNTIEQSCRKTIAAISDGLSWVRNERNARKVGNDKARLERILRRSGLEANRLERTLSRPMGVGIFGPSQAGKSYLISILARKDGSEQLIAKFSGKFSELDFISQINPPEGKECTGLVTRFTMKPQQTPDGFPVTLRLLSQVDIAKIILNTYYNDSSQEHERDVTPEILDAHLTAYESRNDDKPAGALTEDDIWDLHEYVSKNSRGASTAKAFEGGWERIARVAPRLKASERGTFLSLLWGGHNVFTAVFDRLVAALGKLDYAGEVFCPIEGLVPSKPGILNVATLDGLLADNAETLEVRTVSGPPVVVARPIITALGMELRIVLRDEPQPFFRYTDLLDFPGYRSRENWDWTSCFKANPNAFAKDSFLRGKIDYLFQIYTANLELTSLVLCLPDSSQEVKTLGAAMENWIVVTHGATPEKRVGKPNLLFFALTKFDRHLSETAGMERDDPALRFENRLEASLLEPFGKMAQSWPRQWTPGNSFKNMFWIRNPNFKSEHIINYQDRREVEIIPSKIDRIRELRSACATSFLVKDHFESPEKAWDEVMKLNDGGVNYLADSISKVSTPNLKLSQVSSRLTELRNEVWYLLDPLHVSDNYQKEKEARLAILDQEILSDLDICAQNLTFGSALRGMMIDASDLYAALSEALKKPDPASQRRSLGDRVRGKPTQKPTEDKMSRIAAAALKSWHNLMLNRAEDLIFSRRVGIKVENLKHIVDELRIASTRRGLAEEIATRLRAIVEGNEISDSLSRKVSMVAQRSINHFVAQLGFDKEGPEQQLRTYGEDIETPIFVPKKIEFDIVDLPKEAPDFADQFMFDWSRGLRATVAQNAMSASGLVEDPQQNAKLGEILVMVSN